MHALQEILSLCFILDRKEDKLIYSRLRCLRYGITVWGTSNKTRMNLLKVRQTKLVKILLFHIFTHLERLIFETWIEFMN